MNPFRILLVAAAYLGAGRLGLLLAIPPGYATAVWPPAGIALAALLIGGRRLWPGVLLGSFLTNLSTRYDGPESGAVAAAIAVGATVQAILGETLIRRFVGATLDLVRPREIAGFFLLAGPVSCVAAATIGAGSLYLGNQIKANEIPFNWWTWWVGDVIGVAVVAPLVLIAFGEPRDLWRRRARPVALPLAVLLALVIGSFIYVRKQESDRISSQFQARATTLAAAVQARLEESVAVLRSLERDPAATPEFNGTAFRNLVEPRLARDRSIHALSWNPRVLDADRAAFEQGGADGPCPIKDRDHKQRLIPAPKRNEYVPIRYIEPREQNGSALGFDVSSGIARFEALRRAADGGGPAVTGSIRLVQEGSASGHLLFLPVYARFVEIKTVEDRRRHLVGYFAAALRLDDFLRSVGLQAAEAAIDVIVVDGAAEAGVDPYWRSSPGTGGATTPPEFQHAIPLEFGGARWSALCRATPAYEASVRSWRPWSILAGGMVATALLGACLLAVSAKARLTPRSPGA